MQTLSDERTLEATLEKAYSGSRIDIEDAARLFAFASLPDLAALGTKARFSIHPRKVVTCAAAIRIPWAIAAEEAERLERFGGAGVTEIHLVGSVPADWEASDAASRLRAISAEAPDADLIGLSSEDLLRFADRSGIELRSVEEILKDAGWIGFVMSDPPRDPREIEAMRIAGEIGAVVVVEIRSSASETISERLAPIFRWRELQEETKAIQTVVPMNLSEDGRTAGSAYDYLRIVSLARMIADNAPHLRASIETQGMKIAQMALEYGADDLGEAMATFAESGLRFDPLPAVMERHILETGSSPIYRNVRYEERPAPRS